ncbi:MAG: metallophosphoesterase family protein [Elusimicrobia bacterium]|nr:metallophosphoesterase family protein [Elusimicrobiota bacterium]
MRIGPSSLHGLPRDSGYVSRRALGHYKLRELVAVGLVALAALGLLVAAAGLLAGLGNGLPQGIRLAVLSGAGVTGACMLYALLIEPSRLTVRRVDLTSPKARGEGLRILHLSDPHVRRWGRLEEAVVAAARALKPDLILMTGDYTAVPCKPEDGRRLIAELAGVAPTLCCRGNGDYRPPPVDALFEGTGAELLRGASRELTVGSTRVRVTGIEPGHEAEVRGIPEAGPDVFSVCLYHYPDLVPELAALPLDLMLCGHTHGGQVRLPLLGAVTSLSRVDTAFCRGLFASAGRHAFVTQGLGSESYGLAPLRFLCPPEAVLITVRPPGAEKQELC